MLQFLRSNVGDVVGNGAAISVKISTRDLRHKRCPKIFEVERMP